MNSKILNIKGAGLDRYQLENYLEKIASDHILVNNSSKATYPVPRLKENFKFITKTYEILNEHLKIGINIHPAGEWLLDNYYIIEEVVKNIEKDLTLEKYTNFLAVQNGMYSKTARIYILAAEIVAYTDGKIDSENLKNLLKAYQRKKTLNMEEIWNIGTFLQIALIENIREVCEKIYITQIQKYKVESIVERLVENKKELKFVNNPSYQVKDLIPGQMMYPFVEYMSYKLKKYGRQAISYLNILEEQVNKMGTTVSEIIEKEHFDVALKKVLIGNCIKSIKELGRINFLEIFEQINGVEEILKKDPANVYQNMDYKTKGYYRNTIKEISKKTKISEIYIASKALELAKQNNTNKKITKEAHIGYYLVSNGLDKLMNILQVKNKRLKTNTKVNMYILSTLGISALLSILTCLYLQKFTQNIILSILVGITAYIPFIEIITKISNTFLSKIIKPKIIPKMDFSKGIPKEYATFVVIPTIIGNEKKVKNLVKKLEVYYLANKTPNMYFAILGDCTSGDKKEESYDEKIIKVARDEINKLNMKYPNSKIPLFHFVYRNRIWNNKENMFLGWERKRGLLNQFNEYLLGNSKNMFRENSLEGLDIPKIKYIITLDSDTNLVLNSGIELVGAMAHILNKPEIDENKNIVVNGYGIMQPRVGINLVDGNKSLFTKIFAGLPGTDAYANAISDVYQDNFGEGIFTGKGIYDLETFSRILKNRIPENKVLSHDLLEGSYLRCGLVSDIMLLDGYPWKYSSFISRLSRWIRGDFQIIEWLFRRVKNSQGNFERNPLNQLSKFKILDNLRRSLVEITLLLSLFLLGIISYVYKIKVWFIALILVLSVFIPIIIDVILKKESLPKQKAFTPYITGIKGSFIAGIINFSFLPHKAYISLKSMVKALYRLIYSKQNLLEWTTSEEAEKKSANGLLDYINLMKINIIIGIITLIWLSKFEMNIGTIIMILVSILWIIAPIIAWYISIEKLEENKYDGLNKDEQKYILQLGEKTWKYFNDFINEENNYLPPDNYQEDRKEKIVFRTSPTNIGLGLLAIVSAFDLEYIKLDKAMDMLKKSMETIMKLEKWNGHLYNWYNTKTLKPLFPRYISTVDNGNFIGYIYTLKQFLIRVTKNEKTDSENYKLATEMINNCENIILNMNFSLLYDSEKGIFSIGFNVEENKLTDSYYDLLASEARQASLIAIAKKDIPAKHWNNLSRTLTSLNGYKGLISWSGTAFEYLMPNINIVKYPGSLLDESCKFLIMSSREYSQKLGIPWGISETAFNLKDLNSNYQYKAFGIPWLGLKRGLGEEKVITPYASALALTEIPSQVIQNLMQIQKQDMEGKYGLYESIDYTPERLSSDSKSAPVKTYMAHHQALILLSINNLVNNNVLQKRFMHNPEIEAVDILLQERMPINVITTKERKEKIEKIKYSDYTPYTERVIIAQNYLPETNIISNNKYTVYINEKGEGVSKYKNIIINKYKETDDYSQGIFFYIKNIQTQKVWQVAKWGENQKCEVYFMPDKCKFICKKDNIETNLKIGISPDEPVEIRNLKIKNNGNKEEILEISTVLEPVLSSKEQEYAHPAFNKLFLKAEYLDETGTILVKRKSRNQNQDWYLGMNLYTENETIGELEYEIDRAKLLGRGANQIPEMIQNSIPFSKNLKLVPDMDVAMKKTIKIKPKEEISINLLIAVSEEREKIEENIKKYRNEENIKKSFEISKIKAQEEARYLGITGKEIEKYQKILSYVVFQNQTKKLYLNKISNLEYKQCDLWKYGISGDLPIILLKIKDANDMYVVEDMLKAYEYFRVKNINVDLVILNEEENIYEKYVKEGIERKIQNKQLAYLQNIKGGIYIINSKEMEDKNLIEFKANLIIDAHEGKVDSILKYMEKDYLESRKNIGKLPVKVQNEQIETAGKVFEKDNLKYYNEYGGFSENGREYIIRINKNNKLPTTWGHVIANQNFGTIVTENMGGFTWSRNSRLNRLSAWNNNLVLDIPSEAIFLKDLKNGKLWSLGALPIPDENDYFITYGFGYANYEHVSDNLLQNVETFVAKEDKIKINIIKIKNVLPEKRKLKIVYYIKPVLGEDEIKTKGNILLKQKGNVILLKNLYSEDIENNTVFVSSSENIKSYTGSKTSFMGSGNIYNPEALNQVSLDEENSLGQIPCVAIEFDIEIEEFESKEIVLLFGEGKDNEEINKYIVKYKKIEDAKKELQEVKQFWFDKLNTIQVKTPVESINIMLNGWAAYQTIACRLWARSGIYQSGGAFGFRDQLQDTLGVKLIDVNLMKNQIIKHASHQFIEGDVEHWWHDESKKGIRTRFSDDLLWLAYVVAEYINYTGDKSILDEEVPYITGKILEEGENENYDYHPQTNIKESIYMHCIKAIDKSINLGKNNLPKIGSGDWNDGFSTVGNKGIGESVWLAFFLYNILDKFIPICKEKQDTEKVQKYEKTMQILKKAINENAWDGRWYKRAYTDDGKVIGSMQNEEARIDGISQSWSVISKAGDQEKEKIAMEELENQLIDKENAIIKLLDPPFEKSDINPGYIKAYMPGVRENGGQYTHEYCC